MNLVILGFFWIAMVLSTAYLLLAHFHSTITIHLLHFLHRIGWDNSTARKAVWDQFPEFEPISISTSDGKEYNMEWQDWFILAFNETWLQRFIADLITCPICITVHFIFWQTAIALTAFYFICDVSPWVFILLPVYPLTAAIPSLTLYKYARRQL